MNWFIGLLLAAVSSATLADSWRYEVSSDKMTSQVTAIASLISTNSLNLDFPYQGRNYGLLTIRKHPRHGLNVIVNIQKGQILCHHFDSCAVVVRFDDRPPIRFGGSPPADASSQIVFLNSADRFITQAKGAKRILVQMTIHQAGDQILEFHTDTPLAWPPKQ